MDQVEIVTFLAEIENHLASLERLADHIHDKLHNHTPLFKPAPRMRISDGTVTLFPYLACHVKHSVSPEPHALRHLDKPEPACQHHITLSGIDFFT